MSKNTSVLWVTYAGLLFCQSIDQTTLAELVDDNGNPTDPKSAATVSRLKMRLRERLALICAIELDGKDPITGQLIIPSHLTSIQVAYNDIPF